MSLAQSLEEKILIFYDNFETLYLHFSRPFYRHWRMKRYGAQQRALEYISAYLRGTIDKLPRLRTVFGRSHGRKKRKGQRARRSRKKKKKRYKKKKRRRKSYRLGLDLLPLHPSIAYPQAPPPPIELKVSGYETSGFFFEEMKNGMDGKAWC